MAGTTDTHMVAIDIGDVRRGKLNPNLLLLPNLLLIPTSTMDVDMVFMVDTMVMVLDTMVMDMDMDCGDARKGKLKPNLLLLPNHLLIPTSTMDVDTVFIVDTTVMVLDTMVMDMDMDCGDARKGKL